MKVENGTFTENSPQISLRRPFWLRKKIEFEKTLKLKKILRRFHLYTICEEARCPNISECFSQKAVTFLILGNRCPQGCRFCALEKGNPLPPDPKEPQKIAQVVKLLKIRWVILTSPCREDLKDKGVGQFLKTMKEIRKVNSEIIIELLIPDFSLDRRLINELVKLKPQIIGHNLETVERLYPLIKSGNSYYRALELLKLIKKEDKKIFTKSALILGMGERKEEIFRTFLDLRRVDCDFLSIGQYLQSSPKNIKVKEYVPLEKFKEYKEVAESLGFRHVESSPYTRSSYKAWSYFNGENL